MEYSTLLLLHVFLGIIWAGGAIAIGFFILPAVFETGPQVAAQSWPVWPVAGSR